MATVYLPFGYQAQSGTLEGTIVYQGTMVRVYTVPTDPRTEGQHVERKLFADLGRVRGTLGLWGRGSLKATLGSRWPGNLTQLIKADEFGWWHDAGIAWQGFAEISKQAWRDACPYKATFNDYGFVFWMLCNFIAHALDEYSTVPWGTMIYQEQNSQDALAWWTKGYSDALGRGYYNDNDPHITWVTYGFEFYMVGGKFAYLYATNGGAYSGLAYVDGVFLAEVWTNGGSGALIYTLPSRGLHHVYLNVNSIQDAPMLRVY